MQFSKICISYGYNWRSFGWSGTLSKYILPVQSFMSIFRLILLFAICKSASPLPLLGPHAVSSYHSSCFLHLSKVGGRVMGACSQVQVLKESFMYMRKHPHACCRGGGHGFKDYKAMLQKHICICFTWFKPTANSGGQMPACTSCQCRQPQFANASAGIAFHRYTTRSQSIDIWHFHSALYHLDIFSSLETYLRKVHLLFHCHWLVSHK